MGGGGVSASPEWFHVEPVRDYVEMRLLPAMPEDSGTYARLLSFEEADNLSRSLMQVAATVRAQAREGSPEEFTRTLRMSDHLGMIGDDLTAWQQAREKAFTNSGHGSHAKITEQTDGMIAQIRESLLRIQRILLAQPETSGIHTAIEQAPRDPEAELAQRLLAHAQVTHGVVRIPLSPSARRMAGQPVDSN